MTAAREGVGGWFIRLFDTADGPGNAWLNVLFGGVGNCVIVGKSARGEDRSGAFGGHWCVVLLIVLFVKVLALRLAFSSTAGYNRMVTNVFRR